MPSKPSPNLPNGSTEIVFTKVQEIGRFIEGPGDLNLVDAFFQAIADDTKEVVTSFGETNVDYQAVTTSGTFRVTVDHEPTPLTPEEARKLERQELRRSKKTHNESRSDVKSAQDEEINPMEYDDHYYVVINDLGWGSPRFAYGPTTAQKAAVEFQKLVLKPSDHMAPTVTFVLPKYVEQEAFEDVRPIEDLQPDYDQYLENIEEYS